MNSTYLALIIGPVYKTIKQARSTRELWAASYLFSALMREILSASSGKFGTLLSPGFDDDSNSRYGAGMYPDKAFWKLKQPKDADALSTVLEDVFKKISEISGLTTEQQNAYFRIYAVRVVDEWPADESPILNLDKLLNVWELQEKISASKPDVINTLANNIQLLYDNGHTQPREDGGVFIWYDCLAKYNKRLPSIIELASADLKQLNHSQYDAITTDPISAHVCEMIKLGKKATELAKEEFKEQDEIIKKLKAAFGNDFRFRHKYIAFVKADGDNLGEILKKVGNDEVNTLRFSTLLRDFILKAVKMIIKYGGLPVYAGGDDLLFLLPVQTVNIETSKGTGENLFELIHHLDGLFPSEGLALLSTEKVVKPTLSFGVSLSYYKFPMAEALDAADLALSRSKKFDGKNAVTFEVRKHSGQQFGATLQKQGSYKAFYEMFKKYKNFGDDAFLTSVMHKLISQQLLYKDAITSNSLPFFFKHHFNEKDHNTKFNNYLTNVRELTEQLFAESGDASQITKVVFAILRFVQFINQPDHE